MIDVRSTMRQHLLVLTAIALASGGFSLVGGLPAANAVAQNGMDGGYIPMQPARLADMSPTTHGQTLLPHGTASAELMGVAGAPPQSGLGGFVTLDVSVLDATEPGYLTVYGASERRPSPATIYFNAHERASDTVLVQADDVVDVYNGSSGTERVLIDVEGYTISSGNASGSTYQISPTKVLDTRLGVGGARDPIPAHHGVSFDVGPQASGASAVWLNLSAIHPAATGHLTAKPYGVASSMRSATFTAHRQSSNLVLVPVGADGKVTVVNDSDGSTDVVATLEGGVLAGASAVPGAVHGLVGSQILDTAVGLGAPRRPLAAGHTLALQVTGHAHVPSGGVGMVALELLTSAATGSGHLSVRAPGQEPANVFTVDYAPNAVRSTLVLAPVSAGGVVDLAAGGSGSTRVQAFVEGYSLSATIVAGRVTNTAGHPVAQLSVLDGVASSKTDADGRYAIGVVDQGAQHVCFSLSPTGGQYPAYGYADTCYDGQTTASPTAVPTTPGVTTTLHTTVYAGGAISGVETDDSGHLLADEGAALYLNNKFFISGGGSDRGYEFTHLPAGTYHVCFGPRTSDQDDAGLAGLAGQCYDDQPFGTPTDVVVRSGVLSSGIDARLQPGAGATGTVTLQSGRSSTGFDVIAVRDGATIGSAQVNSDGTFAMGGMVPGPVHICTDTQTDFDPLTCVDADGDGQPDDIMLTAGQVVRGLAIVVPPAGDITGQVLGPDGALAGATVTVSGSAGPAKTTTTSATGRYAFTQVPLGTYQVCASGAGLTSGCYSTGSSTDVTVTAAHVTSPIDITLAP